MDALLKAGAALDATRKLENTAQPASNPAFRVGASVEGNFKGWGSYYEAVVASINSDGSYALHYDDGDRESAVPESRIRAQGEDLKPRNESGNTPLILAALWSRAGSVCVRATDGVFLTL